MKLDLVINSDIDEMKEYAGKLQSELNFVVRLVSIKEQEMRQEDPNGK